MNSSMARWQLLVCVSCAALLFGAYTFLVSVRGQSSELALHRSAASVLKGLAGTGSDSGENASAFVATTTQEPDAAKRKHTVAEDGAVLAGDVAQEQAFARDGALPADDEVWEQPVADAQRVHLATGEEAVHENNAVDYAAMSSLTFGDWTCSYEPGIMYSGVYLWKNSDHTGGAKMCAESCARSSTCFTWTYHTRDVTSATGTCSFLTDTGFSTKAMNDTFPERDVVSGRCFRRSQCAINGCYSTKLVINTFVSSPYLEPLFRSLARNSFTAFEHTIVVFGGTGRESAPKLDRLQRYAKVTDDPTVVVIETNRSNFDLHGYSMLHRYIDHDLVAADGYLYLLDSVTVEPGFPSVFNSFNFSDPLNIWSVGCPNSNIAAFGAGVVQAYGDSYDGDVGKEEGLLIEWGLASIRGARPLCVWGHVRFLGQRWRDVPYVSEWAAHAGRQAWRYSKFAVTKWIKWGGPFPKCYKSLGCARVLNRKACPSSNHQRKFRPRFRTRKR